MSCHAMLAMLAGAGLCSEQEVGPQGGHHLNGQLKGLKA